MAVVCCATPSELYLEETRSTLLFASRAKLVKTRAQVNEVLDDRSLIRRLQKELAEARRLAGGEGGTSDDIKLREAQAATAAKEAEAKLNRMKTSFLNYGSLLLNSKPADSDVAEQASKDLGKLKRRRVSDGAVGLLSSAEPSLQEVAFRSPTNLPRLAKKIKEAEIERPVSSVAELGLFREALATKADLAENLQLSLQETKAQAVDLDQALQTANKIIADLKSRLEKETSEKLSTAQSLEESILKSNLLKARLQECEETIETRNQSVQQLQSTVSSLESEVQSAASKNEQLQQSLEETKAVLAATLEDKRQVELEATNSKTELLKTSTQLASTHDQLQEAKAELQSSERIAADFQATIVTVSTAQDDALASFEAVKKHLEAVQLELVGSKEREAELQMKYDEISKTFAQSEVDSQTAMAQLATDLSNAIAYSTETERALGLTKAELEQNTALYLDTKRQLEEAKEDVVQLQVAQEILKNSQDSLTTNVKSLTTEQSALMTQLADIEANKLILEEEIKERVASIASKDSEIEDLRMKLNEAVKSKSDSDAAALQERNELKTSLAVLEGTIESLQLALARKDSEVSMLAEERETLTSQRSLLDCRIHDLELNLEQSKVLVARLEEEQQASTIRLRDANEVSEELVNKSRELQCQLDEALSQLEQIQSDASSLSEDLDANMTALMTSQTEASALMEERDTLARACREAEQKHADITLECEAANRKIEELEASDAALKHSLHELEKSVLSISTERESLQSQLDAEKTKSSDLSQTLTKTQAALDAVKSKLELESQRVVILSAENEESLRLAAAKEQDLVRSKDNYTSLQMALDDAQISLKLARENITELEAAFATATSECDAALNSLQDSEKELDHLRETKAQLQSDLTKISLDLSETNEENIRLRTELESLLIEAESELGHKTKVLQALAEKDEALQQANDDITRLQKELSEANATLDLTRAKISELELTVAETLLQKDTALRALGESETSAEELRRMKEQLESDVSGLAKELSDATSKSERLQRDIDEKLGEKESEVEALKEELDLLQLALQDTSSSVTSKDDELRALREELDNKQGALEELEVKLRSDVEIAFKSLRDRDQIIQSLNETKDRIEGELSKAASDLSTATEDNARLRSEMDAMRSNLTTLDERTTELQTVREELDHAQIALEEMRLERDAVCMSLQERQRAAEEFKATKDRLELELENASSDLSSNQAENARLRSDILLASKALEKEEAECQALREKLDCTLLALHEAISSLDIARASDGERVADVESKRDALQLSLAERELDIASLRGEKEQLQLELTTLTSNLSEIMNDNARLQSRIDSAAQYTHDYEEKTHEVQVLKKERDDLLVALEELQSALEQAQETAEELEKVSETAKTEKETALVSLRNLTAELSATKTENERLHTEMGAASVSSQLLAEREAELQTVKDELNDTQVALEETNISLEWARENLAKIEASLKSEIGVIRESLQQREQTIDDLQEDRKKMETDFQKVSLDLSKAIADNARLQTEIDTVVATAQELDSSRAEALIFVKLKEEELMRVKDDLYNSTVALDEAKSSLKLFRDKTKDLEAALLSANSMRDVASTLAEDRGRTIDGLHCCKEQLESALRDVASDFSNAKAEISRLQSELGVTRSSEDFDTSRSDKVRLLEAENLELKQLLVNSNTSVAEARDAALAADEELADKEKELDDANMRLADLEEQLRLARSGFATNEIESQLMRELEQLRNEKLEAQSLLHKQRQEWEQIVAELEHRMGEEQRTLIQEAEAEMQKLREDNARTKGRLVKAEVEAYNARQEVDELREKVKLSSASDLDLVDLKRQLASQKKAYSDAVRGKENEIAELAEKLSVNERKLELLEQTCRSLTNTVEREKEAHISEESELRQQAETYKTSCQELSHRLQILDNETRNAQVEVLELANLKNRISDLEQTLKKKEERITKLEGSKMTKKWLEIHKQVKVCDLK